MAASALPNVKQKQKILFSESATPEALAALAERFFAAGWFNDAIDFWERAEHAEGIRRVRTLASDQGDVFLLNRCLRAQNATADEAEWHALADRALALGKLQFAREAYRKAGDRKAMDKIDELIRPTEQAAAPGAEAEEAAQDDTQE